MRVYAQLTREQRYQIEALLKTGHNQTMIAKVLSAHKSTISRELKRNHGLRGYRPKQAHEKAMQRRHEKSKTRIPLTTWVLVNALIKQDWSPEQISIRLLMEQDISISHESIYLHIYQDKYQGGNLHNTCVARKNGANDMGNKIAGGVSPTASALMNAQPLLIINPVLATGKAIRSSARAIKA